MNLKWLEQIYKMYSRYIPYPNKEVWQYDNFDLSFCSKSYKKKKKSHK